MQIKRNNHMIANCLIDVQNFQFVFALPHMWVLGVQGGRAMFSYINDLHWIHDKFSMQSYNTQLSFLNTQANHRMLYSFLNTQTHHLKGDHEVT